MPDFKSKLHEDDEKPDKNLKVKPADGDDPEKKLKNLKKVKKNSAFTWLTDQIFELLL